MLWLFFLIVGFGQLFLSASFLAWLKPGVQALQNSCHVFVEFFTVSAMASPLFCGVTRDLPPEFVADLKMAGFYHMIVVSGSHFTFLRQVMTWLRTPNWLQQAVLCTFCCLSGLQAPALRSLLEGFLGNGGREQKIFLSWLACLLLAPSWIDSLSLHLSAILALCIASIRMEHWFSGLFLCLLLSVALSGFNGGPGWLTIWASLLLAPIILCSWCLEILIGMAGLTAGSWKFLYQELGQFQNSAAPITNLNSLLIIGIITLVLSPSPQNKSGRFSPCLIYLFVLLNAQSVA